MALSSSAGIYESKDVEKADSEIGPCLCGSGRLKKTNNFLSCFTAVLKFTSVPY
jgi:hypothetical protein